MTMEEADVPRTFLVTHTKHRMPDGADAEGSYTVEGVFVSAVHADEAIRLVDEKHPDWVVSEMEAFECNPNNGAVLDLACT